MLLLVNAALRRKLLNTTFFIARSTLRYTLDISFALHYYTCVTERWPKASHRKETKTAIFLTVHEFTIRTNRFGVLNRVATEP